MRVAVLGSAGQLGRDLLACLGPRAIPLTRAELDLSQPATIAPALVHAGASVVVNCAAYNFVDRAESEPDAAFAVNAWGVRALAQACGAVGARLIHISTDYVFGLERSPQQPWSEDAPPGPVSVYGASKLTGEYMVRAFAPNHLIVRTCGLYGAWGSGGKGGNFVETMLRVAAQGKPLRVVNDQLCTPTSTVDLALAIEQLLRTPSTGIVHITNAGSCSWYEFAGEIFRLEGVSPELQPIPSSEYPVPARRPGYSVLNCDRLISLGVTPPRHWTAALADYLKHRRERLAAVSGTSVP
jgi:dTDP-4-dehydrorhamnose reductase